MNSLFEKASVFGQKILSVLHSEDISQSSVVNPWSTAPYSTQLQYIQAGLLTIGILGFTVFCIVFVGRLLFGSNSDESHTDSSSTSSSAVFVMVFAVLGVIALCLSAVNTYAGILTGNGISHVVNVYDNAFAPIPESQLNAMKLFVDSNRDALNSIINEGDQNQQKSALKTAIDTTISSNAIFGSTSNAVDKAAGLTGNFSPEIASLSSLQSQVSDLLAKMFENHRVLKVVYGQGFEQLQALGSNDDRVNKIIEKMRGWYDITTLDTTVSSVSKQWPRTPDVKASVANLLLEFEQQILPSPTEAAKPDVSSKPQQTPAPTASPAPSFATAVKQCIIATEGGVETNGGPIGILSFDNVVNLLRSFDIYLPLTYGIGGLVLLSLLLTSSGYTVAMGRSSSYGTNPSYSLLNTSALLLALAYSAYLVLNAFIVPNAVIVGNVCKNSGDKFNEFANQQSVSAFPACRACDMVILMSSAEADTLPESLKLQLASLDAKTLVTKTQISDTLTRMQASEQLVKSAKVSTLSNNLPWEQDVAALKNQPTSTTTPAVSSDTLQGIDLIATQLTTNLREYTASYSQLQEQFKTLKPLLDSLNRELQKLGQDVVREVKKIESSGAKTESSAIKTESSGAKTESSATTTASPKSILTATTNQISDSSAACAQIQGIASDKKPQTVNEFYDALCNSTLPPLDSLWLSGVGNAIVIVPLAFVVLFSVTIVVSNYYLTTKPVGDVL